MIPATPESARLYIEGGIPLQGDVVISGAKNSVLKLMAAALLTTEPVIIENVPRLSDVDVMMSVLSHLGAQVGWQGPNTIGIQASQLGTVEAPFELVSKMRASFNVLAPLLSRFGTARVSLPGGCSIGKRGIDLHVKGLQALGADVEIVHGFVEAKANKLYGADVIFDLPSVGATENIMVAAVLAEGTTTITNAAQEPEIVDLANFLNAMGADVHGAGSHKIVIHGVAAHTLRGITHAVIPDRIEAATFLLAGAATQGQVTIAHCIPEHIRSLTTKLEDMGATLVQKGLDVLEIKAKHPLQSEHIVTLPYPGFPTDLQAPMMALMATCEGSSVVRETIYENRFGHVDFLRRMGAQIELDNNVAVVHGVPKLSAASVDASDLRAAAALILAALMADGMTDIGALHHLDRGYDNIEGKLLRLGATISRRGASEYPTGRVEPSRLAQF